MMVKREVKLNSRLRRRSAAFGRLCDEAGTAYKSILGDPASFEVIAATF